MINQRVKIKQVTNFVHEPYKAVHVRDLIRMDLDDLINTISTLESANAYWAGGVLFVSFSISESDELGKKEIYGETYLDKIMFTRYDKYTKTARSTTNVVINVVNVHRSRLYQELTSWLKNQSEWNE